MTRILLKPASPWWGGRTAQRFGWGATALLLFAASSFPAGAAQTPMAATLHVSVDGITLAGGTLIVGLYDEATFPVVPDAPLFKRAISKVAGSATVIFERLPPGAYAVKVLQDVNNDGKAERGEPSGMSNGAAPGNFDAAAVALQPGNNAMTIHIR